MTGRPRPILLALLLALTPAGAGETTSSTTRQVDHLLASPTDVLGGAPLADAATWRVTVPADALVCVDAREDGAAPFTLRASDGHMQLGSVVPTLAQSLLLPGPATWLLRADPAAGADVHIHLTLRGAYVDCGLAPAPFSIDDLPRPCETEGGACLP